MRLTAGTLLLQICLKSSFKHLYSYLVGLEVPTSKICVCPCAGSKGSDKTKSAKAYLSRPPDKSAYWKIIFSYFSTKTYVVGTQKNRLNRSTASLNKTVLLSTKTLLKLMVKEINAIFKRCTIYPYLDL